MPSVDFRAVRAAVPIVTVLRLIGWHPRRQHGAQWRGRCPIHGSTSPSSTAFSVNVAAGVFHCFKCGAQGNHLDLYAQVRQLTPYAAALELCTRAGITVPLLPLLAQGAASPCS